MKISTKGRYAIRVMVDLAVNGLGKNIPLKDIANRQEISLKYLESIMVILSKAGFVEAHHGKGGGYRLNRPADEYTVGSILKLTEGSLAPIACLEESAAKCSLASECKTLPMWEKFYEMIEDYFEGITLADLVNQDDVGNYII